MVIKDLSITPQEREEFRAFYEVLTSLADELDQKTREIAAEIPVFARIIETMDEASMLEQRERSRRLQRDALVDNQWPEYLADLQLQGATYAQMGIALLDWFKLLRPYRRVVREYTQEYPGPQSEIILNGMNHFIDVAMAAIGSAYVETKEDMVRVTESQLQLYVDMFQGSNMGKSIYKWEDPKDRGSFRLIATNPAAVRLLGAQQLGNVGKLIGEDGGGALDPQVPEFLTSSIHTGEARTWLRRLDGHDFEVRCFPLHGNYVGVIFDDVTLQKNMQRELNKYVRELERSNRELDDFAFVASHDLKAPLRDLDNLAKWVVEDIGPSVPPSSARHLSLIQDRAGRMERLLDDLLEFSRAGRVFSESESFVVSAVIDDTVRLLAPEPRFKVQISGASIEIQSPKTPLAQILRNLINNAMKHHHREHGEITIQVREFDEDMLQFTVEDDGPGIAEEFHERVFRMFQTLRPRDEVEGSGMGLAIVKKLVESFQGTVSIRSAAGAGASIAFTWPRHWTPQNEKAGI